MPKKLSHYNAQGQARMVDVSAKARTVREAEASAFVLMSPKVLRALPENPKGDPLEVARTAGILAAKRTSDLIPMCHPIPPLAHCCHLTRVREWRFCRHKSKNHRRNRRGDGSSGRRQCGGADGLRHVQGA